MKVTAFSVNDLDPDLLGDLFIVAIACSDGFVRSVVAPPNGCCHVTEAYKLLLLLFLLLYLCLLFFSSTG